MTSEARQRIDKWLYFARVVKSRSLAAKLAQSGRVRLNGDKIDQPSRQVGCEDVLTVTLDRKILVLKIVGFAERRGPYSEAKMLYEDISPPPVARDRTATPALAPYREAGSGRPTKRERRQLDKLKSSDE
ncbi:RNA-binding S4 domain-containing protein [Hoeflea prorocentri]|uniref:RNA-binding S4 domain-containing protein n=1 Tax=Hoeflea prorocentri TaxID=1922333 RepID=A0A9X3ZK13_9HYPH|nr:RNA-binding S4 domain-containing protein [Hoeflea prorocentri]MCY6383551.1 RNA-binding S4 domain-containing protein [Hoeflea prorocentri]MDA5401351.1 RNA-binding S4 domain-containing protein [Hoeflea prorocentri]